MTKKTESKKPQKRSLVIWLEGPDGNTRYAGAAYRHKKGTGHDILIGGLRYVAFEPKENLQGEEGA